MANSDRRDRYNLECRDPVHGFIYLSEAEWAIVDCPTFQRLRDIRQLAMAHLVYPGATHTRFEHSLGCLHLSGVIYRAVERQAQRKNCPNFARAFRADAEQEKRGYQLVRLAGLMHDLGHTPFSHSGEKLMPEIEVDGKRRKATHEDMTARLIRETEVAKKLKTEFEAEIVEEVIAVATKPELAKLPKGTDLAWYRFLNDILAGELGSDRMDYLLRDAVHSGQSVGLFDYRKLIDSMTIVPPPKETEEGHRLGLDEAGWLIGEQMVAARYLMYVSLYFHKTARIYEIHLEDFIAAWLAQKYRQPHFPVANLSEYSRLTDSQVWAAIYETAQSPNNELRHLARPFVDRTHLRLACELLPADNYEPTATPGVVREVLKVFEDRVRSLAQGTMNANQALTGLRRDLGPILSRRHPRVWDESRFDNLKNAVHNNVKFKLGTIRTDQTKHNAAKFFDPKDKIWVYLNEKTRYLDELSEIVSGMPDRIWRGRIYAAEKIRKSVKSFCEKWLRANPLAKGVANVRKEPSPGRMGPGHRGRAETKR
jgi:HD superfamily phosphohydrolase